MKTYLALTERNIKLFFKDKGLFFSSLLTPIILLVLYVAFLANVYRSNMVSAIPEGFEMPEKIINGVVGGQLMSSLLAVITVSVAFCSNMILVSDKITGARKDFSVTPLKKHVSALSYFTASMAVTIIICFVATAACFIYVGVTGWYLSVGDVFLMFLDIFLLSLFGTALSSFIYCFLTTQGQMQAVGTIVGAGYGFICGAYMPLSNLSSGLQAASMFLPGTYGTSLVRTHALRGVMDEMLSIGVPEAVVKGIKDSIDCNIYFFGHAVSEAAMYLVLVLFTAAVIGAFILATVLLGKRKNQEPRKIKLFKRENTK